MALAKFAEDSVLFDFDCTNLLGPTEVISGEVTMSALPSAFPAEDLALLVFGAPLVNVAPITYPDGRVMAIGKGFQVRISGGKSSAVEQRVYSVLGVFATNEGNTLTTKASLILLSPSPSIIN